MSEQLEGILEAIRLTAADYRRRYNMAPEDPLMAYVPHQLDVTAIQERIDATDWNVQIDPVPMTLPDGYAEILIMKPNTWCNRRRELYC